MIQTRNASTLEIDDLDLAVEEVTRQLLPEGRPLLKNTVGILTCHYEFVESGVVKALCEALPFDVVGVTSTEQAVNDANGILILTMMVLTSDTVVFQTGCSASLSKEVEGPIRSAYRDLLAGLGTKPDLVLLFAPLLLKYAGDIYVKVLDDETGQVPLFGSLSMDTQSDYHNCYTIYNGVAQRDTMAMVLVSGDISPRFYIATLSGDNILSLPARITASEGNILKEINGQPFVTFLEGIGLARGGRINSDLQLLVVLIDYKDGTPPLGKVLIKLDENGHGICGGNMQEGLDFSIAYLTRDDVLKTTQNTIQRVVEDMAAQPQDVFLTFSCNTRNMALGSDYAAEFDKVHDLVGDDLPYIISASGGEICPFIDESGGVHNRFQNNSFIVCTF